MPANDNTWLYRDLRDYRIRHGYYLESIGDMVHLIVGTGNPCHIDLTRMRAARRCMITWGWDESDEEEAFELRYEDGSTEPYRLIVSQLKARVLFGLLEARQVRHMVWLRSPSDDVGVCVLDIPAAYAPSLEAQAAFSVDEMALVVREPGALF